MTQEQLAKECDVTRRTICNYLKNLEIKAKDIDEDNLDWFKGQIINMKVAKTEQERNEKIKNMSKKSKKNLEKLGISATNKKEAINGLEQKFAYNETIIKNCEDQLDADGNFTFDKFGNLKEHPAIRIRERTISINNKITKLIDDLDAFKKEKKKNNFKDMDNLL